MFLSSPFDPPLNLLDFIFIIFRGVIFVVNIAPGRPNMFWSVYRVFVVDWIGEGYIAILTLTFFGIDILPSINFVSFLSAFCAHCFFSFFTLPFYLYLV